ncbi:hypothetical protein CS022_21295 [Veronia nyctiphanis]|uniref:YcaO domain-containing protein n=1 Tax=Veronia nyctiphanis TaxID=1278244 RepID=A0A4Q0YMK5_9GAMM|nr:YcaO-like family protein [Veronia nyctiphanis]RXJ71204.1 hypothetical protein CS022_21295 [Veronia nyctiphanis]
MSSSISCIQAVIDGAKNLTPSAIQIVAALQQNNASLSDDATLTIVANEGYLLLLPHGKGQSGQSLERVNTLSRGLKVYPSHQLRWQMDIKLKVQLEHAVLQCLETGESGHRDTGVVFLYLNGHFEQRYFPAVLDALPSTQCFNVSDNPAHRLYNPKVNAITQCFGPQSLANLTVHFDQEGRMCSCFDGALNVVGIGRGNDRHQRLAGAVYEYLERRVSAELPDNIRWTSATTLAENAVTPYQLFGADTQRDSVLFPHYSDTTEMAWMPATDGVSGQQKWVPAAMVCYLNKHLENVSFNTNSNGCALGNSYQEASFYALLEIIERDALLLTWYTQSCPQRISLGSELPPSLQTLCHLIQMQGYRLHLFDITTELNIPVVLSVIEGETDDNMAVFVTAGAHTDPKVALENAVSEAYSLMGLCERNYHRARTSEVVTSNADQYLHYADPAQKTEFRFLLDASEQISLSDFVRRHHAADTPENAMAQLQGCLHRHGYSALLVEHTPDYLRDLGLHWVRAYVPGLINLTFGEHPVFVCRERVARAADASPWLNDRAVGYFPTLHPLG